MQKEFLFLNEEGERAKVIFNIIVNNEYNKRIGISARLEVNDKIEDVNEAPNLFFTYEEAEKTIDMLCKYQVMPSTLKDVI